MKKGFQFWVVLLLVLALGSRTYHSVNAAALSTKTFTECPNYEELRTAVYNDRMVHFDLSTACTVSFEEEITLDRYAVIRNVGEGKLIFDGNGQDSNDENDTSFFSVNSGGLELYNITLRNGKGVDGGALSVKGGYAVLDHVVLRNNVASAVGGALYFSSGDIEIRNSSFIGNSTLGEPTASSGSGGAIYASNFGLSSRLFILSSTFENNQTGDSQFDSSGRGGAIYVYDVQGSLLVNIFNSTFYRNSTGDSLMSNVGDGGAIYANDYDGAASLNIYHSTFSENGTGFTMSGSPGEGQTLYLREASLNMAGTILGNSISSYGGTGKDCDFRGAVSINDGGYNLIENMGDCREYFSRSTEGDPGLVMGLAANGGATQTVALRADSQAVDQIPVGMTAHAINLCGYDFADQDQRGELRPGNERCDIGAYEIVDENHPYVLPSTGFPQGQVTQLSSTKETFSALAAESGGMQLVIPALGVATEIVGVPEDVNGWNVEWLDDQIGYLNGTAFPTWQGNSVLTGHAYNRLGQASVFADLGKLGYNDLITIEAWGQEYIFAVRERYQTDADDLSVLAHSDETQLTLITCTGYDPISMTYPLRQVVVAVLVAVR